MVDRVDMVETVELVDAVDMVVMVGTGDLMEILMGETVLTVEMVDLWAGIELTRAMAGMCKMKMKHLLSLINNTLKVKLL